MADPRITTEFKTPEPVTVFSDTQTDRELALDLAVRLNIVRGQTISPFPTGRDVVVDAEAFLAFLKDSPQPEINAPHLTEETA